MPRLRHFACVILCAAAGLPGCGEVRPRAPAAEPGAAKAEPTRLKVFRVRQREMAPAPTVSPGPAAERDELQRRVEQSLAAAAQAEEALQQANTDYAAALYAAAVLRRGGEETGAEALLAEADAAIKHAEESMGAARGGLRDARRELAEWAPAEPASPSWLPAVPVSAVAEEEAGVFVIRVSAEGELARVRVETGPERVGYVAILSGVKEGDRVLVSGPQDAPTGRVPLGRLQEVRG